MIKSRAIIIFGLVTFLIFTWHLSADTSFSTVKEDKIEQPNVVLISLESIPDYKLPCYGYDRNTAPNLCKFAEDEATIYENAYSSSGFTPPALSGISTGFYPFEIGATGHKSKISPEVSTIAEKLSKNSYTTLGQGLEDVGVQRLDDGFQKKLNSHNLSETLQESDDPVFIQYHEWGTHSPYIGFSLSEKHPSDKKYIEDIDREEAEKVQHHENIKPVDEEVINRTYINNLFDENLRAKDKHVFREVIQSIKNSGEYDNTMIIFVGDHGEMLGEDGLYGHPPVGNRDELISVPMIIKYPEQEDPERVSDLVSTIDIAPTVLEITGTDFEEDYFSGNSLISNLGHEAVFSYHSIYAMITEEYKISRCDSVEIHAYCEGGANHTLFEYGENREEIEPREVKPELADKMNQELSSFDKLEFLKMIEDDEERENLEQTMEELGYVE